MTKEILDLMTPEELFTQTEFPKPEPIHPGIYTSFDSLLEKREDIRNLRLVPVKSDEQYHRFHAQSQDALLAEVLENLKDTSIRLAVNGYPYFLPEDLYQGIIWLKDPETSRIVIAEFIEEVLNKTGSTPEGIILFERPLKMDTKLVRGSFPAVRHVHFWIRNSWH